jgi:erythromycin esterase-like protein
LLLSACANKTNQDTPVPATAASKGVHALKTAADLDILLQEIGDDKYVLLGEASHGTHEYYTWRAEITKRLVEEKGFNIIAVEGDWPDAFQVNQYIKGRQPAADAREVLKSFNRWPTWMWANEEIAGLAEWLKTYNSRQGARQAGFYGLDVYSLWKSMEVVMAYLDKTDPAAAQKARAAYQCFASYNKDEQAYATATARNPNLCASELSEMLSAVQASIQAKGSNEETFNIEQNALAAVNAQRYYHAMVRSSTESWNIRDRHMMQTINRLMQLHGPDAKIIVWEHNTHIGDARATDMAAEGMVNVGQLVREQHGADQTYIVGFGSYQGSVIAGSAWEAPMQKMNVPPAQPNSWEALMHGIAPADKIIITREWRDDPEMMKIRGNRAIGVVYNPGREQGNYVPTRLPDRYDAFLFIDKTQALKPLNVPSGKQNRVAGTNALSVLLPLY